MCLSSAVYASFAAAAEFRSRRGDVKGLLSATEITASDASLWRRAGLQLLDDDPARAQACLQRAIQLSSRDADALLGLAFLSEKSGDTKKAEQYYQTAANVSRRFKPGYALAGFYFRRDNRSRFWAQASIAAAIPGADLQGVFRAAHQLSEQPREVADLLNLTSQHSLVSYMTFLLKMGHVDGSADIAEQIEPVNAQRELLLDACDKLLDAGRTAEAGRVWNHLAGKANPAFTQLDPEGGRVLTNGTFLPAPMRGFNWRSYSMPEVSVDFVEPSGLQLEFSGKQPEAGGIVYQPLWLLPERKCRLRYRAAASDLSLFAGLQWAIVAENKLVVTAPWQNGSTGGFFDFQAAASPSLLVLRHARSVGAVRVRGSLTLLSAELTCLP